MSRIAQHKSKLNYLLQNGIHVLWQKGYHGTSVNDIVGAADVPKGSFYSYFDSKEDFVVKALQYYHEQQVAPALQILEDARISPLQRIINFYEYRINNAQTCAVQERGCMVSNLATEMAGQSEIIRETVVALDNKLKTKASEVLSKAKEKGEIKNNHDPIEIIGFAEDALKGALTSAKASKNNQPLQTCLKFIKHLLVV
ncbi:TetR/AcrR family transcriptional regulator [Flavobacteriaceae bacterium M23B6Z8]